MHQSNTISQGSPSHGQTLAAMGILVVLAITVPMLGLVMIPVAALGTMARVVRDAAGETAP